MDYRRFRALLVEAGITNKEFAEAVGINVKTVSNYSKTEVPNSFAVIASCIYYMQKNGIDYKEALEHVDLKDRLPVEPKFGKTPNMFQTSSKNH